MNTIIQSIKKTAVYCVKQFVLHPFFLGIYFVLEGYPSVAEHMHVPELIVPIAIVSFCIACVYFLILLIARDKIKSGLLASVIVFGILFYTDIFSFFNTWAPGVASTRNIMCIVAAYMVIVCWAIVNSKRKWVYLNAFLNVVTAFYIIYGMVLVGESVKARQVHARIILSDAPAVAGAPLPDSKQLPDIYYLIFDAHTRADSLKQYFDYDESDFIGTLEKEGFYVAAESRAFSSRTTSSMASSLNMSSSEGLLEDSEEEAVDAIENSSAVNYLKGSSYDIVNLSFFDLPGSPRFYQFFFIGEKSHRNFYGLFVRMALFHIKAKLSVSKVFRVNLDIYSRLKEMPYTRQKNPRFIYAHLMLPHLPYCFDRQGNIIPWRNRKAEADKRAYLDQLIFTDKMILDLARHILDNSRPKPVIIIQGDHGFRRLEGDAEEKEALSILNAYYLPGGGGRLLYPDISPFNSFRVVLNYYLGAEYALLDEK